MWLLDDFEFDMSKSKVAPIVDNGHDFYSLELIRFRLINCISWFTYIIEIHLVLKENIQTSMFFFH